METRQMGQDDALVLVHVRNEFYKRKFRFALGLFLLALTITFFLIGALVYLLKHPTQPLYFVTDKVGRLIQDVSPTVPNMTTEDAAKWAIEAVEGAYSYDFVNYRSELQNAQKYFSDFGWQEYMKGLRISNNILALTQRKMIFIAKVVDKPKLIVEGMLGGAYAWKFQMHLLVTYMTPPFDAKTTFRNPLVVTVVVQRQSILTSYKGLKVIQMIGSLVLSPSQQSMVAPPN